ncbi:hypothetical protein A2627_05575 [Candidatus Woesebacteria bacterium RIFCSPHIGHO2_01_FULL_39_28]|uniref:HTH cro/C1-type domain-containing protein n=1 Tax=Candidatus Woesebacteria bacterium RIFCSPHIGHO2_01_FULL_39_28 TaxID=1802496 RepID=A0A1F7YK32_9BACT|nr:MAG: hypothetical protein A2627_05575 [Candidatus Woesebacteria bacterium RIFCSPHIGHO2_01_FULL_39_28]OGM56741.1 MAG: hypothetical protein A3A50_04770 [Candidatus Woesebacteria bacterium RIFCSPLOWO2_01_FULL_38_20]
MRFTNKVAEHIQKIRTRQHISQEELAFKAGLNPAYVSHLERGIYSPTLYVFWKLAKALGMSVSDLLKGI